MTFIGKDGVPAPKLKDVHWTATRLNRTFAKVLAQMRAMYHDCSLVHCDLSEYNLLLWHKEPYIIDVGQAVDVKHPRATEYLFRDCINVRTFFERAGATDLPSPGEMFRTISDMGLTSEQESDFAAKISCAGRGAFKRWETELLQEGASDIVLRYGDGVALPGADDVKETDDSDEESDEEEEEEEEEESKGEGQGGESGERAAEAKAAGGGAEAARGEAAEGDGCATGQPTGTEAATHRN